MAEALRYPRPKTRPYRIKSYCLGSDVGFFPPLFSRRQIEKSLFVRRTADATVDRYRNLGMEHLARSVTYLDTLPSPVCSAYYLPYRSMCERVIASSG